jgi:hypothetical protein
MLFARHPARSGSRSVTPSASSSEAGQQGVVAGYDAPRQEMKAAIGVLQRVNVVRLDLCILGGIIRSSSMLGPSMHHAMTGTKSSNVVGTKAGQDHVEAVVSGERLLFSSWRVSRLPNASGRTTRQGSPGRLSAAGRRWIGNGRGLFLQCVRSWRAKLTAAPRHRDGKPAICIMHGSAYVPGMKPLPSVFAVCCVRDRWLAVAPSEWPGGRTFERKQLRAVDSGALGVSSDNDAPIVLRLALLPSATA